MSTKKLSKKAKRRMMKRVSINETRTAIHHTVEYKLARQRDWITVFSLVEAVAIISMIVWYFR